jgi:hypothetical protein
VTIARDVSDMPLVLCGPIVRKVTHEMASVFVALKEPRRLCLEVHEHDQVSLDFVAGELVATRPIGRALHVAVVTVETPLTPGKTYGYDLVIEDAAGARTSFGNAPHEVYGGWPIHSPLAAVEPMFVFENGKLPTFVCPPTDRKDLRAIHGSCRKPHGQGTDMLALVDDLLRAAPAGERPQLMLLTGDQIYADDVAFALLRMLNETAKHLLGWRENLHSFSPVGSTLFSDGHWADRDLDPARISPPRRIAEVRASSGLSSDFADAHLIFLGEYLMMYLFVWSDAVWPGDALPTVLEAVPSYTLAGPTTKPAIEAQIAALHGFRASLPKVRRALANIATYMIFDDHEVTDDWNLNADWVKRVHDSTMGGRVLLNGLLAYAVFQDWGNSPEDYLPGEKGHRILEALVGADAGGQPSPPPVVASSTTARELAELMGATATPIAIPLRKRWDHVIGPFGDADSYQILMLDGRTMRGFPDQSLIDQAASAVKAFLHDNNASAGLVLPAAVLDADAFTAQVSERLGTDAAGNPVPKVSLIVAPGPVFNEPFIESFGQRFEVLRTGAEAADHEVWSGNARAFGSMLDALKAQTHGAIIISGDVHYAFSNAIEFPGHRQRIVQVCSSSQKNHGFDAVLLGYLGRPERFSDLISIGFARHREMSAFIDAKLAAFIKQVEEGPIGDLNDALGAVAAFGTWFDTTAGRFYDPMSLALKLRDVNPLTLPNAFVMPLQAELAVRLASGTYAAVLSDLSQPLVPLPDNRVLRSTPLKDVRGADLDLVVGPLPAGRDLAEREATGGVNDEAPPLDAKAARVAASQMRVIVGYNNLGRLSFGDGGGTVLHTLYWRAHDEYGREQPRVMTTVHSSALVGA